MTEFTHLMLVYLPHLDYDPQRFGPSGTDMAKCVKELDDAVAPILDAAAKWGTQVWVVSEYGHCDVTRPVYPNRVLRTAGLLEVRPGPFGEQLDLYGSRAFAVCDHQIAHVYVQDPADIPRVRDVLAPVPGVGRVLARDERAEVRLDHPRSGEIVLLSDRDAWFAYPFWLDDAVAPDYARCVAIHHKPGFDPCELFFDPKLRAPKLHAGRRLVAKEARLPDEVRRDPTRRGHRPRQPRPPGRRPARRGHPHRPRPPAIGRHGADVRGEGANPGGTRLGVDVSRGAAESRRRKNNRSHAVGREQRDC